MPQTRFGKFILVCIAVMFAYVTYKDGYRLYEWAVPSKKAERLAQEENTLLAGLADKAKLRAATLKEQIPGLIDKIAAGHTDPETIALLDAAVLEWRRLYPPAAINVRELLTRNTEEDRVRYYSKLVSDIDAAREAVTAAGARNNLSAFIAALKAAAVDSDVSYQFVSSQINRLRRDRLYREAYDTFKKRADEALRKMREAAAIDLATTVQFVPEFRDALQSFYNATRDTLYTYPTIIREERSESKDIANEFSLRFVKIFGEGKDGVRTKAAREVRARQAIQLIADYMGTPIARERFEMTLSRIAEDVQAPAETDRRSEIIPSAPQAPAPSSVTELTSSAPPLVTQRASLTPLKEPASAAVTRWRTAAGSDLLAGRNQGTVVTDAIRDFYKAGRAAGHVLPLTKAQEEGEGKRQGIAFQKRLATLYQARTVTIASARARFSNALRLIEENLGKPIAAERFEQLVTYMRSDLEFLYDYITEPVTAAPRSYAPRIYESGPRAYAPGYQPFFPHIIIR
jgi:hypothetical protein